MTLPIDTEKLAPSGERAKLPALGAPEATPEFLGRVKEAIEILAGMRGGAGSNWDRAVTWRDLYDQNGNSTGWSLGGQSGSPIAGMSAGSYQQLISRLQADLMASSAFRELRRAIGSAEDLASFPEEIRIQLEQRLSDLARQRQADILSVDRKIQTGSVSMASRLTEITASLEQAASGIRTLDATYADKVRAVATSIKQLVARLDDVGGVTIEEKFITQADLIDGLLGQWSIKIQTGTDGNPVIAGIALSSKGPNADETTSSLVFMADEYGFFSPNGTVMPFGIDTATGNIYVNGQLLVGTGGKSLATLTDSMINFVGEFASAPAVANYRANDVYKNTTDGNTYILKDASGTKSWATFITSGTGTKGDTGQRGTVNIMAATDGTAWSDSAAAAAISGGGYGSPVRYDQVTLHNAGAKFSESRIYDGSGWISVAAYINGNLIVPGTILASMIDTNGLIVRDNAGNPIIGAGVTLPLANVPSEALNSELTPAIQSAQATADTAAARDVSNIVKKSSFEDNLVGGWNAQGVEPIVGTYANTVPYTKQLVTRTRDCLETNNYFRVTPGETLYYESWLNTEASTKQCCFGVIFLDNNGGFAGTSGVPYVNPGLGWGHFTGSGIVPDNAAVAVPWLWENGDVASGDFVNGNWLRAAGMWIGRHARGATVGAPAGTYVGGTEAGLLASRALNGDAAYNALGDKLSKTSASDLAAQVTLQTGGAILAGTPTNGSYHNASGFYGVQGGVVKFSCPISGDPTFGGQLTAAYGTFGALSVAAGGFLSIQASAFNSDPGIWFGIVNGVAKGSFVAPSGAKIIFDPSANPQIQLVNVSTTSSFAAGITDNDGSYYHTVGRSIDGAYAGTYTAGTANGIGPYTYSWSVTNYGIVDGWISGSANGQQAVLNVNGKGIRNEDGSPNEADFYLQCIVTDVGGNIVRTVSQLTIVAFV